MDIKSILNTLKCIKEKDINLRQEKANYHFPVPICKDIEIRDTWLWFKSTKLNPIHFFGDTEKKHFHSP